jgi:hypothetical protein
MAELDAPLARAGAVGAGLAPVSDTWFAKPGVLDASGTDRPFVHCRNSVRLQCYFAFPTLPPACLLVTQTGSNSVSRLGILGQMN